MLYCFSGKDIDIARDDDPLAIQYRYACFLQQCLILRDTMSKQAIINLSAQVKEERVIARGSYEQSRVMLDALSAAGARMVETLDEFHQVEEWPTAGVAKRQVACVDMDSLASYVAENYDDNSVVFIKSLHKGFSARISSKRLLSYDPEVDAFTSRMRRLFGNRIIVSEYQNIKHDSLGPLEARFICIDGSVTSCSRPLFSLRHSVPSRLEKGGRDILQSLLGADNFPKSFALDVGVFSSDGHEWVDVVEVNPISASTCYANNTVFDEAPLEIQKVARRLRMGPEYCYDYLACPDRYMLHRKTGVDYSVSNGLRYAFM